MDFDLSQIAAYGAGGAFLANWAISGLTLAQPNRPAWLPFLLAALLSIGFVALMTLAGAPAGFVWTAQVWANIVIVGLLGAAGATGASWTQNSAAAKREQALAAKQAPELDPPVSPETLVSHD